MLFNNIIFFLKKEKLTHKLLYSKTIKSEPLVALLGVFFGAFFVYISLNIFGFSGVNLDELSVLFSYILLLFYTYKSFINYNIKNKITVFYIYVKVLIKLIIIC